MSINNYGLHPANNKNMHLIIGSNTANENKGMKSNIINVTNSAISHAINEEKSGGDIVVFLSENWPKYRAYPFRQRIIRSITAIICFH